MKLDFRVGNRYVNRELLRNWGTVRGNPPESLQSVTGPGFDAGARLCHIMA